jgi:hypothetical protein
VGGQLGHGPDFGDEEPVAVDAEPLAVGMFTGRGEPDQVDPPSAVSVLSLTDVTISYFGLTKTRRSVLSKCRVAWCELQTGSARGLDVNHFLKLG